MIIYIMNSLKKYLSESLFDVDLIEKRPYDKIDTQTLENIIYEIYSKFKEKHKDIYIEDFHINDPNTGSNYKYASTVYIKWSDIYSTYKYNYFISFSFSNGDKKIILGNITVDLTIDNYSTLTIPNRNRFVIIPNAISWKVKDPKTSDILNIYKFINGFFDGVYELQKKSRNFLIKNINDPYIKLQEKFYNQCKKWFKI